MLPDDSIRLQHMKESAEWTMKFVQGRSRTDLEQDVQLQFALARAIEIIGEAASKISAETKSSLPDIPWITIIGIRNRLAHAYFRIDYDILWNTATVSVPALLQQLERARPD